MQQALSRDDTLRQDGLRAPAELVTKSDLANIRHWKDVFCDYCKDRRYYELVEDTIRQGFDYRYLVFKNGTNEVYAVQPVFLLDQDLLAGTPDIVKNIAVSIRRWWPHFMQLRTLMVGCAAGEGRLDCQYRSESHAFAAELVRALKTTASTTHAKLIVLKEFPSEYREELSPLSSCGFTASRASRWSGCSSIMQISKTICGVASAGACEDTCDESFAV